MSAVELERFTDTPAGWVDQVDDDEDLSATGPWASSMADVVTLVPEPGPVEAPPRDVEPTKHPFDRLVDRWVRLACSHARTRHLDRKVWVADVVGVPGAWSEGETQTAALVALPDVVNEWVRMKLADGDRDIPPMEGCKLVVEE